MADKLLMIALSPTMEKGTIIKWLINENEIFKEGDVLCEVETDKTTMEYEATEEGTLLKILVPEGGKAAVGEPIAIFGDKGEDISEILNELNNDKNATNNENTKNEIKEIKINSSIKNENIDINMNNKEKIKISPLAKKLALMKNIDISNVKGSGPDGRIIKRDIENYKLPTKTHETQTISLNNNDDIIPLSDKRRIIGERLSKSKYTAPHFYLTVSVNMENILESRKQINNNLNEKISMNAFLIKIIANTLKKHKRINSSLHNDKIIEFGRVDIAIAVAQKDGLITPVIRDAHKKGILQIENDLKYLIDKAKNNKLDPEDYSNPTFTISNLGSFGVEEFTAIINSPASAILAIGMIKDIPVVENKEIKIKPIMKITLSSDHRVIDGAVAAAFVKDLKDSLENPILALL